MSLAIAGLVLFILLVVGVIYVLSAIPQAYIDFKGRPKEAMEWCHRHGYFRRKHVLPFMGTTVCPRCYWEAWQKADKGELGK